MAIENHKLKKQISEIKPKLKEGPKSDKDIQNSVWNDVSNQLSEESNGYLEWVDLFQKRCSKIHQKIFDMVKQKISEFFQVNFEIKWSGSVASGLNFPWSDCNFEIKFFKTVSEFHIFQQFQDFCDSFKDIFISSSIERKSCITILKLTSTPKYESKKIEIIFKRTYQTGPPSKDEIISIYMKRFQLLRPLYIILRSMLHKANLDNPAEGGLINLGLVLMIASYLQQYSHLHSEGMLSCGSTSTSLSDSREKDESHSPPMTRTSACEELSHLKRNEDKTSTWTWEGDRETESDSIFALNNQSKSSLLGDALLGFLSYFAFSFDYQLYCLSPSVDEDKVKSPVYHKTSNFINSLMIRNPFSPEIIITKNFKRTIELQNFFKLCFFTAFSSCSCPLKKAIRVSVERDEAANSTRVLFRCTEETSWNGDAHNFKNGLQARNLVKMLNLSNWSDDLI